MTALAQRELHPHYCPECGELAKASPRSPRCASCKARRQAARAAGPRRLQELYPCAPCHFAVSFPTATDLQNHVTVVHGARGCGRG